MFLMFGDRFSIFEFLDIFEFFVLELKVKVLIF